MADVRHEKHVNFDWTPVNLGFAILMGAVATLGLWLFAGLLMGLFMI